MPFIHSDYAYLLVYIFGGNAMKFYVIYRVSTNTYHGRSRLSGAPRLFDTVQQAEDELAKIESRMKHAYQASKNSSIRVPFFNADDWEIHEVSLNSIRRV